MYIDYKEVGKRIARRRKYLGLKQSDVVENTEFSGNYVSHLETARTKPSIEAIMLVCKALDTTPDYLLLGATNEKEVGENIKQKIKLLDDKKLSFLSDFIDLLIEKDI